MKVFGLQVFWYFTLFIGLFLIASGLLLIIHPELLAYFVAGVLLFAGFCFVSSAFFVKKTSSKNFFVV